MKNDDLEHGLPESATHSGSNVDDADTDKTAKPSFSLQELRDVVEGLERLARSLTALKKRSSFKVIE